MDGHCSQIYEIEQKQKAQESDAKGATSSRGRIACPHRRGRPCEIEHISEQRFEFASLSAPDPLLGSLL